MALNFPDSPTLNQVYTDTTSGFSYQWDGVVWQSYSPAASKNISIVDDIEGSFNGSTQTFSLAVAGTAFTPINAQQLRVVLGGIVQEPLTDYTVSGSNITFTTSPAGGLNCSIVSLGPSIPQNNVTPIDGSVTTVKLADGSVTPAKLSTGGPYWNTSGDVYISGITTLANKVKVGVGTTALIVEGDARITGILTIGTSSITFDGTNNEVRVGSGMTIGSTGINIGGVTISSTGINMSGSSLISGVGIQSGGVAVGYGITTLNFVGTGNTFAINGNRVDISISGGGGVSSQWITTAAGIHTLSNVGIGTTNPSSKLEVAGVIKDSNGNVRAIPNNSKTGAYVLTADDVGELINITTGGVTVPENVFSAGNSVTIYNNSGSNQTITQGTNVTLRLAGTVTTGNRTLAQRGITTVMCVASNEFVISGAGLS